MYQRRIEDGCYERSTINGKRQKRIGLEAVRRQIETAETDVIQTKKKYVEATDRLKALLDLEKELQADELMKAIAVSKRSYEDILRYIRSNPDED